MRNENERRATQPTFAAADRNVAIAAETFALKPRRVRSRLTWENEIVRLAIPDVGLLILIRIRLCIAYLEFHRAITAKLALAKPFHSRQLRTEASSPQEI